MSPTSRTENEGVESNSSTESSAQDLRSTSPVVKLRAKTASTADQLDTNAEEHVMNNHFPDLVLNLINVTRSRKQHSYVSHYSQEQEAILAPLRAPMTQPIVQEAGPPGALRLRYRQLAVTESERQKMHHLKQLTGETKRILFVAPRQVVLQPVDASENVETKTRLGSTSQSLRMVHVDPRSLTPSRISMNQSLTPSRISRNHETKPNIQHPQPTFGSSLNMTRDFVQSFSDDLHQLEKLTQSVQDLNVKTEQSGVSKTTSKMNLKTQVVGSKLNSRRNSTASAVSKKSNILVPPRNMNRRHSLAAPPISLPPIAVQDSSEEALPSITSQHPSIILSQPEMNLEKTSLTIQQDHAFRPDVWTPSERSLRSSKSQSTASIRSSSSNPNFHTAPVRRISSKIYEPPPAVLHHRRTSWVGDTMNAVPNAASVAQRRQLTLDNSPLPVAIRPFRQYTPAHARFDAAPQELSQEDITAASSSVVPGGRWHSQQKQLVQQCLEKNANFSESLLSQALLPPVDKSYRTLHVELVAFTRQQKGKASWRRFARDLPLETAYLYEQWRQERLLLSDNEQEEDSNSISSTKHQRHNLTQLFIYPPTSSATAELMRRKSEVAENSDNNNTTYQNEELPSRQNSMSTENAKSTPFPIQRRHVAPRVHCWWSHKEVQQLKAKRAETHENHKIQRHRSFNILVQPKTGPFTLGTRKQYERRRRVASKVGDEVNTEEKEIGNGSNQAPWRVAAMSPESHWFPSAPPVRPPSAPPTVLSMNTLTSLITRPKRQRALTGPLPVGNSSMFDNNILPSTPIYMQDTSPIRYRPALLF